MSESKKGKKKSQPVNSGAAGSATVVVVEKEPKASNAKTKARKVRRRKQKSNSNVSGSGGFQTSPSGLIIGTAYNSKTAPDVTLQQSCTLDWQGISGGSAPKNGLPVILPISIGIPYIGVRDVATDGQVQIAEVERLLKFDTWSRTQFGLYNKYRITHLTLEWAPHEGTTTVGSMHVGYCDDILDAFRGGCKVPDAVSTATYQPWQTGPATGSAYTFMTIGEISQLRPSSVFSVYHPWRMDFKFPNSPWSRVDPEIEIGVVTSDGGSGGNLRPVTPSGIARQEVPLGAICMMLDSTAADRSMDLLGYWRVHYKIELRNPVPPRLNWSKISETPPADTRVTHVVNLAEVSKGSNSFGFSRGRPFVRTGQTRLVKEISQGDTEDILRVRVNLSSLLQPSIRVSITGTCQFTLTSEGGSILSPYISDAADFIEGDLIPHADEEDVILLIHANKVCDSSAFTLTWKVPE